ncbi:MAG: glycerophosphodiester phosphodiesterase [Bacteroidales bacterium]
MKSLLPTLIIFLLAVMSCSQNTKKSQKENNAIYLNSANRMLVIGHRGEPDIAPENTMSSNKLAWKMGADMVECDVWLTADNKIVVIHDENTQRVSGEYMEIEKSTADSLQKLDVGKVKNPEYVKEKIPLLSELINAIPKGKKLVIEIKSEDQIVPYLSREIDSLKADSLVEFISFHLNAIKAIKKSLPHIPSYLLIDSLSQQQVFALVDSAKINGLDGVDVHHGIVNKAFMDKATQEDFPVITWTVDSLTEAERLRKLGVAAITTNRAGFMLKNLYGITPAESVPEGALK